ncbi:hypothetical protein Taro_054301 [Colocasia esculenta]|uniref:Uncharacterized protein n=1 Tax=Colocasia esculenta TaxID=4460 RepID=A0A843XNC2_COLES|nr:hypothetical protein [Colocasia esculenta]
MGSKYLDELLCMSFFEPPSRQFHGKDHYIMHDLIHDLAEYVSRDDCLRLEDQKLVGETPDTTVRHVSFWHLQPYECGLLSLIDGVGKLTGLQELQVRGRQLRELGGMCMLRELKITYLEEVGSKEEAIQARLQGKELLQILKLEWRGRGSWSMNQDSRKPELEEEVLQALRPNKGIRELHIQGYKGSKSPDWMEVPTLLTSFSSLRRVSLKYCSNWQVLSCSRVDGGIETTSSPHPSPPTSASLSRLDISSCGNLTSISGLLQQQLPNLVEMDINHCKNLVSLPEKGFGHLVSLKMLKLTECPKLTCLAQKEDEDALSQHLPCSLEELEISRCGDAMGGWWWAGMERLTSISKLSLCGCPTTIELLFDRLKRNPHPHLPATLRQLQIKGCNRSEHGQQSSTSSACSSQLSPPPTLPPIPHSNVGASEGVLRAFTSLKELTIRDSPNFLQKWGGCGPPSSLERLTVAGDDDLSHEDLSAWWHNLISLKKLILENLSALPDLSGLSSLTNLHVYDCPSIQSWPASGLPSSLNYLEIRECPALTERHVGKPKSLWPEVARIPRVDIDGKPN